MTKYLNQIFLTFGCIFLLAFAGVVYAVNNNTFDIFTYFKMHDTQVTGIRRIQIQFVEQRIFLDVHLNSPLTCKEVVRDLEIQPFNVEQKTFIPTCAKVTNEEIRVTYDERHS